jgi:hypothetical protein
MSEERRNINTSKTTWLQTPWKKKTLTTITETTSRLQSWGWNKTFIDITSWPEEESMFLCSEQFLKSLSWASCKVMLNHCGPNLNSPYDVQRRSSMLNVIEIRWLVSEMRQVAWRWGRRINTPFFLWVRFIRSLQKKVNKIDTFECP